MPKALLVSALQNPTVKDDPFAPEVAPTPFEVGLKNLI